MHRARGGSGLDRNNPDGSGKWTQSIEYSYEPFICSSGTEVMNPSLLSL